MLVSGQNCEDYAASGPVNSGKPCGAQGETGWMFVKQVDPILTLRPKAFMLEMTSNAVNVNEGREVREVCSRLSEHYYVHKVDRVQTSKYMDVSNRSRLIIVGFDKVILGEYGKNFQFPNYITGDDYYPIALDVAIPDEQVPEKYLINDKPMLLPQVVIT